MSAAQSNAMTLFELFELKAHAHLTGYDTAFLKATSILGNEGDYADEFIWYPTALTQPDVQLVRIPVPLTAPELKLFKGRTHFITNSTGYIELEKKPYQNGVKEFLRKINAADWVGFGIMPEVFAGIIAAWPSQNAVAQLATGESTASWDGTNFLSATKYSNPYKRDMKIPGTATLATYKNFWNGSVLNTTNVQLMRADMLKRRGFDNRPLGYRGTHLVASPDLFPDAESVCKDQRLANGATNPVEKYKLIPECWYDLPAKRWGLVHKDTNRPIFVASKGTPQTNVYGVTSAMYERQKKVGWDVEVDLAVGLGRAESISIGVNP